MGHVYCAAHCDCLSSDLIYDPLQCDTCITFIKGNFAGATDEGLIRTGSDVLERHIRKLRRFASGLEGSRQVKFSKFLDNVRRSARAKVLDMDFFSKLSVGEGKTDDNDAVSQVTSVRSTQASGSITNPRPRGSSPSKNMREDMELLKGQVASMQGAIARLLELPALQPKKPGRSPTSSRQSEERSRSLVTEDPVEPQPRKPGRGRSHDEPRQAGHSSRRTMGGNSMHLSELESGRGSSRGSRGASERCSKCGLGRGSQHACEVGSDYERPGSRPRSETGSRSTRCLAPRVRTVDHGFLPTHSLTLIVMMRLCHHWKVNRRIVSRRTTIWSSLSHLRCSIATLICFRTPTSRLLSGTGQKERSRSGQWGSSTLSGTVYQRPF